uniref:G-protein coupled receptors family 1 profile domain-containing protein n=1 Tax=Terrapene triunguis TaxID=2587831 RepID=A0A674JW08_9SAUR
MAIGFILLGVSDQPCLEMLLFVVFLVLYVLNLVGNLAVIVVLWLEPSLHTPCIPSLATSPSWIFATPPAPFLRCCFGNSILQTSLTVWLPQCGEDWVDHFFCKVLALLKLVCVNTSDNEAQAFAVNVIFRLVPLGLILVSYGYIGTAVHSAHGKYSQDQGKLVSLFYGIIAPMLNSLIYTLRNKEVHGALRRVLGWLFWVRGHKTEKCAWTGWLGSLWGGSSDPVSGQGTGWLRGPGYRIWSLPI